MLGEYHKYSRASFGCHTGITRASQSDPLKVSHMSDILTENRTTDFHLYENQMWELVFLKRTKKKSENQVKSDLLSRSRSQGLATITKLVQALRKKLWASNLIMFLCRMKQSFTFYILLIIYGPWVWTLEVQC